MTNNPWTCLFCHALNAESRWSCRRCHKPNPRTLEQYPFGDMWQKMHMLKCELRNAAALRLISELEADAAIEALAVVQRSLRDSETEHLDTLDRKEQQLCQHARKE